MNKELSGNLFKLDSQIEGRSCQINRTDPVIVDPKNIGTQKYERVRVWNRFHDSHPEYLVRHYWWAYLWRWGVWFFDHQLIINAILLGQYSKLKSQALRACMTSRPKGRLLQLTCAYGNLTPSLIKEINGGDLYIMDVADIQLSAARNKLGDTEKRQLLAARMNVESLAYGDNVFSSILMFFLLHELPSVARERTLSEVARVLRPGGRLVITEYGSCPKHHFLWKLWPLRILLLKLEPFLDEFWREDLSTTLCDHAQKYGKSLRQVDEFCCFAGFYRVCVFEMNESAV